MVSVGSIPTRDMVADMDLEKEEKEMFRELMEEKINRLIKNIPNLEKGGSNFSDVMSSLKNARKHMNVYLRNFDRRKIIDKVKNGEIDVSDTEEDETDKYDTEDLTEYDRYNDDPVYKELIHCLLKDSYKRNSSNVRRVTNILKEKVNLKETTLYNYVLRCFNYSVNKGWLSKRKEGIKGVYEPTNDIEDGFKELGYLVPDTEESISEMNDVLKKESDRYLEERR